MQNHVVYSQNHGVGPSTKPLDSRLSVHLDAVRMVLGPWTEPVLVAYGNYAHHPERLANVLKMLQVCCEAAHQLTNAARTAIALPDGTELIPIAGSGELVPPIGARVESQSWFPGACVKSNQVFLSQHALSDERIDPAIRSRGIRSLIAIPVAKNDQVLGVLEVFSLTDFAFDARQLACLQFIAKIVGEGLSRFCQSQQRNMVHNGLTPGPVVMANGTDRPEELRPSIAVAAQLTEEKTTEGASFPSATVIPPSEKKERTERQDSEGAATNTSSSRLADSGSKRSAERRSRTRTLFDSLAYVSLGDENGGILLNLSDTGFSMQAAFPLDCENRHPRRARFSGNGDFETDCCLVWDQAGQAGFSFTDISTDFLARLRTWAAANGVASSTSDVVPSPLRAEMSVAAARATLDELRSMVLKRERKREPVAM